MGHRGGIILRPQRLLVLQLDYTSRSGVRAIRHQGGGVGSVVTPETGRLSDRDPARLGAAVREVLALPPGTRAEMTRAGRARAEELYDYNRLVAELEDWLDRIRDASS